MEDSDEGLRFLTRTDENLIRRDSMGKCGGFDPYIFESQASAHDADTLKLLADKFACRVLDSRAPPAPAAKPAPRSRSKSQTRARSSASIPPTADSDRCFCCHWSYCFCFVHFGTTHGLS